MILSSFLFLDWKFSILNLPYKFDTQLEAHVIEKTVEEIKWYKKIYQRRGIWEHLTNPLYILVVLFLTFLIITHSHSICHHYHQLFSVLLSVLY